MEELVYGCGDNLKDSILREYPNAKIADASDYVHVDRVEVSIDGITSDDFWLFAFENGFLSQCFRFVLTSQMAPEKLIALNERVRLSMRGGKTCSY